jgi:hypothetical protein
MLIHCPGRPGSVARANPDENGVESGQQCAFGFRASENGGANRHLSQCAAPRSGKSIASDDDEGQIANECSTRSERIQIGSDESAENCLAWLVTRIAWRRKPAYAFSVIALK